VRRVVTGHDSAGRSYFARDGEPPARYELQTGGLILHELWRTGGALPSNGGNEEAVGPTLEITPGPGGTAFRMVELRPGESGAATEMHQTPTTDYNVVVRGELTLVTERDEVTVGAGEVIVLAGGAHSWRNDGTETCVFASVMVGWDQTEDGGKELR
jgi:quercetin dioxygenase-like cupin family protein